MPRGRVVMSAGLVALTLAACSSAATTRSGTTTSSAATTTTSSQSSEASRQSAGCKAPHRAAPGVTVDHLMSGGVNRVYELDIPAGYDGRRPYAIVFGLHPLSIEYSYMASVVRFAVNEPKYDFIGVAPSGILSHGSPFWNAAPVKDNYDVDFISQLLDHLEATFCVDTAEVFSTGISNGAQMSSLLGCRLAGRITAIAPVEGEEYLSPCTGKPEPILAFHGTKDPILPYAGGGLNATTIARDLYYNGHLPPGLPKPLGIDVSMELWAKHNGCLPTPTTVTISSQVEKRTWQGCRAATVLYIIVGGGHGWPGQPVPSFFKTFGFETKQIDATDLMMTFFFGHQMGADLPSSAA